jgi:hypothetical protein
VGKGTLSSGATQNVCVGGSDEGSMVANGAVTFSFDLFKSKDFVVSSDSMKFLAESGLFACWRSSCMTSLLQVLT